MYELMYYSTAKQHINESEITDILNTAKDFNSKNGITGCLLFHNNDFIQVLEGDKKLIIDLFAKILQDNRHSNVNLLAEGEIEDRVFENWSMAYHKLDAEDSGSIEKFLFIKNFLALSELTAKPTEAINLFFYLAKHLLKE